jgi:cyclic pyranopterin monophosphate synthase
MDGLTHLDEHGKARMVDASDRAQTVRTATVTGQVNLSPTALAAIADGTAPKGDVLAIARIAGIMATKRTPDLIPLCHPIAVHGVEVDAAVAPGAVSITATVRTADRTGVEMEAFTAVSVAALTVIDMIKALDPLATITDIRLVSKSGGRSGDWTRGDQ